MSMKILFSKLEKSAHSFLTYTSDFSYLWTLCLTQLPGVNCFVCPLFPIPSATSLVQLPLAWLKCCYLPWVSQGIPTQAPDPCDSSTLVIMQWLLKDDLSPNESKDQTLNLPSESCPSLRSQTCNSHIPSHTPCSLHYSYGLLHQCLVHTGSSIRNPFPLHPWNAWAPLIFITWYSHLLQ